MQIDIPDWALDLNERELLAFIPTKSVKFTTKRSVASYGVNKPLSHAAKEIEKVYPYIRPGVSVTGTYREPYKAKTNFAACKKKACVKKLKSPSRSLSKIVQTEFRLLLCENHSKYRDIKKKLTGASFTGTVPIVAAIAQSMSSFIGVPAPAIMAIIASCLLLLVRIGKEVLCTYLAEVK